MFLKYKYALTVFQAEQQQKNPVSNIHKYI